MIDLREIVARIKDLSRLVASKPDLRWATVTTSTPLAIRMDGETDALLGAPSTLIADLRGGDRVVVALQGTRVTVLGRGSVRPALPPPQGVRLAAAASITAAVGVWQDVPGLAKITVVNPDPVRKMVCRVDLGATGIASAGYARIGVACTGATTITQDQPSTPADPTGGGPHNPFSTGTNVNITGWKVVELNPGSTVFTLRSMRDQTGTHGTNYPGMTITPLFFKETP